MENTTVHEALRRRVEQERTGLRSGRTPRFSDELKVAVGAACKTTTLSHAAFAEAVGVSMSSLNRWRSLAAGDAASRRPPAATKPNGRLVPVGTIALSDEGLTLELPGGARVTGLTIEQLARLLKESR